MAEKKSGDQLDVGRIELANFSPVGSMPTRLIPARRVGLQQRAVVAADVEHDVAGGRLDQRFELADLARQMRHHRLVEAGAVAVVVAVHLRRVVRMFQLQKPAGGRPNQFQRATGTGSSGDFGNTPVSACIPRLSTDTKSSLMPYAAFVDSLVTHLSHDDVILSY